MPRRKSVEEMEKKWTSASGEPVAFVPDLRIMTLATAADCLQVFRRDWGLDDETPAVCLPLVGVAGVSYENTLCAQNTVNAKIDATSATPKTIGQVARDFVDLGCKVYLYVVPTLRFLQVESCHKLDIRGKGTPEACFHRAKTKEFLSYLIGCGIDHVQEHLDDGTDSLAGVVIDITNLWGMGGAGGKVFTTCFCEECRNYFAGKQLPLAEFETFPNPWELLLKDTKTGVSYIDNVSYGETPPSLVGKAALQGFGASFKTETERLHAAELLMQYMIARHEMVEDCLTAVFEEAKIVGENGAERPVKKIALVEGTDYDWTAGVFPGRLSTQVIDELWIDPTDKAPPLQSTHKMFMWRRASYFLNAFFQFLTDVADHRMRTTTGLGRFPAPVIKAQLRERGAKATSNELTGIQQLAALSGLQNPGRDGFVGIVFSDDLLRPLLTNAYIAPGLADHADNVPDAGLPPGILDALMSRIETAREAGMDGGEDDGED